jgi:hypothetical protein
MYSILIKLNTTSDNRWKFLTGDGGAIYEASTLADVEAKVGELLQTNLLSAIKVVKNCIITDTISVEESSAE